MKVLLFDLDDTLLYFHEYWKDSMLETFRRHHLTREFQKAELFSALWEHNQKYEAGNGTIHRLSQLKELLHTRSNEQ
ncbi:hypothetical protein [Paenibacillus sp. HB172176]|uniref:hypothetical protein n=1 Tax=Paenibacillus sp. HB172176 TaxID=2493690 RepID=UPI00143A0849|nr:hypothetical protein [Paenibacillus sp. HB172176]